jgi:hypothetical protein
MYVDRSTRQWRGSIFFLVANTSYDVRVTFVDADGVSGTNPVTGVTATWNDDPQSTGRAISATTSTFAAALSAAVAGDIISLATGTYSAAYTLTVSGTSSNYIRIQPALGATATFTNNLKIKSAYVRITGIGGTMLFSHTPGSAVSISGEDMGAGTVHDIMVDYCTFDHPNTSNTGTQGAVRIDYGAGKCLCQHNTLHLDGDPTIKDWDIKGFTWWDPGFGLNSVFRYNTIDGVFFDGFGGGHEDNPIYFNDCDFYENNVTGAMDDSIQMDGGNRNCRAWSNICLNNFQGFSICPDLIGPYYIFRNIIQSKMSRTLGDGGTMKLGNDTTGPGFIFHNTMYASQAGVDGPFATNNGLMLLRSRNNAVYVTWSVIEFGHDEDAVNLNFDYDYLWSTETGTDRGNGYLKWGESSYSKANVVNGNWTAAEGQESHGILSGADPKFVNPSTLDFHLQSTSPLIDKGIILPGFNDATSPWPYSGTAPDMGAYEYTGVITDPTIAFTPASFTFTATYGGANPVSQTLNLHNSGAGTLSWVVTDNATWLSETPTSGTSTGETDMVAVSASITGLATGTYNAVITITASGATNTPQTVPVTLIVNPTSTLPTIGYTPTSLSFTAYPSVNPTAQTIGILNSGTGTLNWTVTDNAAWLTLSPTSGSSTGETDTVTASVSVTGLTAGNYNATITIAATGAANTPQTVPVSLLILSPPTEAITEVSIEVEGITDSGTRAGVSVREMRSSTSAYFGA